MQRLIRNSTSIFSRNISLQCRNTSRFRRKQLYFWHSKSSQHRNRRNLARKERCQISIWTTSRRHFNEINHPKHEKIFKRRSFTSTRSRINSRPNSEKTKKINSKSRKKGFPKHARNSAWKKNQNAQRIISKTRSPTTNMFMYSTASWKLPTSNYELWWTQTHRTRSNWRENKHKNVYSNAKSWRKHSTNWKIGPKIKTILLHRQSLIFWKEKTQASFTRCSTWLVNSI